MPEVKRIGLTELYRPRDGSMHELEYVLHVPVSFHPLEVFSSKAVKAPPSSQHKKLENENRQHNALEPDVTDTE